MPHIMPHIVVDDEQARIISESSEEVEVRDRSGKCVGYASGAASHGFTPEEIEEAKRRLASDEPRYTTKEVLEYLQSLDPA